MLDTFVQPLLDLLREVSAAITANAGRACQILLATSQVAMQLKKQRFECGV